MCVCSLRVSVVYGRSISFHFISIYVYSIYISIYLFICYQGEEAPDVRQQLRRRTVPVIGYII